MRALAVLVACCIGCSTGLPLANSPDAGDGLGGDGNGNATPDLAGGDVGAPHDLGADLAGPGAPPLHLVVQSVPASTASGTTFTVSFQVLDEANQPVDISRPVFVALGVHPTGAALKGVTTVVANHSVATFQLSLDHWGAYTLVATTPDAPPAETPIVNVHGTKLQWLTQPTTTAAHQPMAPPVRVGVVDVTGSVDTTATGQVNLATGPSSCPGYLLGTPFATVSAGVATFANVVLDKACSGYLLQATGVAPLDPQAIVSASFAIVAGAPAQLTLAASLPHGMASRGQPFNLIAHVEDAGGNEVPLATTVTLSVSPATTLSGPTSVMTSGTTASFAGVTVGVAGSFTFGASAPGLQTGFVSLPVSPWQWRGSNIANLVVDPTTPSVVWIDGASSVYNGQLARSTDQGATFTGVGAPSNSAIRLAIDPSLPTTIYGSSASETWKSIDDGQTTTSLPLTGGTFALTIDPSSSSRLYAVNSTTVWKSVDGGASWSAITPSSASNLTALAVDPSNAAVLYVSGASVWRSADGGTTWSAASGLPASGSDGFSRVTVSPAQPSHVVTCGSSGCYRSVDGGATFAQVYGGSLGYDPIVVAFDPTAPSAVYACGNYGVAASSDGGATFALAPLYPSAVYSCALAPSSPSTIYLTNSDGTWVTTSGGK